MQIITGKVIGDNMPKTLKVEVVRLMAHPRYQKRVKKTRNYLVHDELGAKLGQTVRFIPCKPISKSKKWKVIEIVGLKGRSKNDPAKK